MSRGPAGGGGVRHQRPRGETAQPWACGQTRQLCPWAGDTHGVSGGRPVNPVLLRGVGPSLCPSSGADQQGGPEGLQAAAAGPPPGPRCWLPREPAAFPAPGSPLPPVGPSGWRAAPHRADRGFWGGRSASARSGPTSRAARRPSRPSLPDSKAPTSAGNGHGAPPTADRASRVSSGHRPAARGRRATPRAAGTRGRSHENVFLTRRQLSHSGTEGGSEAWPRTGGAGGTMFQAVGGGAGSPAASLRRALGANLGQLEGELETEAPPGLIYAYFYLISLETK